MPEHKVTQGDIMSPPIIFNILVDVVVQKWYANVMEDMALAITGLEGDVIREQPILLYIDGCASGA